MIHRTEKYFKKKLSLKIAEITGFKMIRIKRTVWWLFWYIPILVHDDIIDIPWMKHTNE